MLLQEPGIDLRQLENLLDRHPVAGTRGEIEDPLGVRHAELAAQRFVIDAHCRAPSPLKPKRLISRLRSAFCSASLNVRPMAIASPTLFICVVSVGSACGNFSKVKRGILTTQ